MQEKNRTFIFVGGEEASGVSDTLGARRVYTPGEIRDALQHDGNTIWVADTLPPLHEYAHMGRGRYRRDLLLFEPIDRPRREVLATMFHQVVAPDDGVQMLPKEIILEVLALENRADFLIGGVYVADDELLLLYRGNLDSLTVPISWFQGNPVATPAPTDLEIVDYGQGIRLGEFEAGTDTLLYEFDPEFRRRRKKNQRELDESLGGSLRRLRLMKGLTQDDFQPLVTARTIRRIEQGKVERPRSSTLEKIAGKLGVEADEIASY